MIDTRSRKISNLSKNRVEGPSLLQLVKDPYIVIATGNRALQLLVIFVNRLIRRCSHNRQLRFISTRGNATNLVGRIDQCTYMAPRFDRTLRIFTLESVWWLLGAVFLPDGIGYIISANVLASLATNLSVWYCTISCLLIQSITLFFVSKNQCS